MSVANDNLSRSDGAPTTTVNKNRIFPPYRRRRRRRHRLRIARVHALLLSPLRVCAENVFFFSYFVYHDNKQ